MKKMDKEKALAGILGIVALVCIVVQLVSGGISTSSVAGAIKDLTGIAIQILVFILAIRIVTKENAEDPSLEDKLKTELEKWMAAHANMISSEEVERKDGKKYRFNMKTDLKNYFDDPEAGTRSGEFMTMPEIGSPEFTKETFEIQFVLNVSTFLEGKVDDDDRKRAFTKIAGIITQKIKSENGVVKVLNSATDGRAVITVTANGLVPDEENGITVDNRIRDFISIINTAYTCYLVAGNLKV